MSEKDQMDLVDSIFDSWNRGRLAAFLVAEVVSSEIVTWHFAGSLPALSAALQILNAFFILFTAWCMK